MLPKIIQILTGIGVTSSYVIGVPEYVQMDNRFKASQKPQSTKLMPLGYLENLERLNAEPMYKRSFMNVDGQSEIDLDSWRQFAKDHNRGDDVYKRFAHVESLLLRSFYI